MSHIYDPERCDVNCPCLDYVPEAVTPTNQETPEPTQEKPVTCMKEMLETMEHDVEEFGYLHGENCSVNMESPDACDCDEMKDIKAFCAQWMDNVNTYWCEMTEAHRKYCTPEGNKDITRLLGKKNRNLATPAVAPDRGTYNHVENCKCTKEMFDNRCAVYPPEQKDFMEGWEEELKEHLLANFCDGDSWIDARADRFTHEGALDIAKYFYAQGEQDMSERAKEATPRALGWPVKGERNRLISQIRADERNTVGNEFIKHFGSFLAFSGEEAGSVELMAKAVQEQMRPKLDDDELRAKVCAEIMKKAQEKARIEEIRGLWIGKPTEVISIAELDTIIRNVSEQKT